MGMDKANPTQTIPKFLTEAQLAEVLQCSVYHLANLRLIGLPFIEVGAAIRYDFDEVLTHLKANRHPIAASGRSRRGKGRGANLTVVANRCAHQRTDICTDILGSGSVQRAECAKSSASNQ